MTTCTRSDIIVLNNARQTTPYITLCEEYDMTANTIIPQIRHFDLCDVKLNNAYLLNAFNKEYEYLVSLDTDRLLAGFRDTAGVDMRGVTRYGGWEDMLIGGHTLGHYVTAVVNEYMSANSSDAQKEKLLDIIEKISDGLLECQEATGTGYIFGAAGVDRDNIELQFDLVEQNRIDIIKESWVPWYTMHKIFEGLLAMTQMTSVRTGDTSRVDRIKNTSLKVASGLADWTCRRAMGWSKETHLTVLSVEYGGIADCLYTLYGITGSPTHLQAAHAFDEDSLFELILHAKPGDNALNNKHANTTIPKFLGALKHYIVTGETQYLEYVKAFWTLVANNHTYITGGNSEWEHFGEDNILDKERTNANCETCNVHNMLKMTKLLFEITGDVKYADWYENAFINAILASQNPETGMTMYFQPMATGYFKTYSDQTANFWCCTGTGMENFSKLQESFYFHTDDSLIVNQYFSSSLCTDDIAITQSSTIPEGNTATLTFDKAYDGKLLLRLPDWLAVDAVIEIDGRRTDYGTISHIGPEAAQGKGYAVIEGDFRAGTVITITLPMEVRAHNLPDGRNTYAFKYGPVVLSALLGTTDMRRTTTGVDVTIPAECILDKCYASEGAIITVDNGQSVDEFITDINSHMMRSLPYDRLAFKLTGTKSNLTYVPHYSQHKERYGLYFTFVK